MRAARVIHLTEQERFWAAQRHAPARGRLQAMEETDIAVGSPLPVHLPDESHAIGVAEGEEDDSELRQIVAMAAAGDPLARYVLDEREAQAARAALRDLKEETTDAALGPNYNGTDPALDALNLRSAAFDAFLNGAYNPHAHRPLISAAQPLPTPRPRPRGRLEARQQRVAASLESLRWLTVTDVAALLGVTRASLLVAITTGHLLAVQTTPGGMYRVIVKEVPQYLTRCGYTAKQIAVVMHAADALFAPS